jgi:endonuclease/exonuclease/phosphatase (EEP) superfamily protein YafD
MAAGEAENKPAIVPSGEEKPSLVRRFLLPSWSHRKHMLRREAGVLVIGSYAALAFAYLWPQDFRNTSQAYVAVSLVAFMIRVFMFHLGLLLAVVAVVSLRTRQRRLLAATAPLILATLGPAAWSYRPKARPSVSGEAVTVMSVNLLMVNKDTGPLTEEIRASGADIVFLQEYTEHWHAALRAALAQDYPYECHVCRDDSFGAAVYSSRPFLSEPELNLSLGLSSLPQIRAVVDISQRPVAIYNVHLLPPTSLKYTTENRLQFADLIDQLAAESMPFILAGDFNFTETTPQAAVLRRVGTVEAYAVGGWGRGSTWPVNSFLRYLPGFRLDHIYLGNGLTCSDCQTGIGRGSDHRPVIAKIGFSR